MATLQEHESEARCQGLEPHPAAAMQDRERRSGAAAASLHVPRRVVVPDVRIVQRLRQHLVVRRPLRGSRTRHRARSLWRHEDRSDAAGTSRMPRHGPVSTAG